MIITDKQLDKFIAFYKIEYDIELPRDKALESAIALLTLVKILLKQDKSKKDHVVVE